MTWQEDLRRLDENLASGNLSADEYRARRDQILSSAVSSPQDPQEAPGDADSTQVVAPVAGGQPSQPQPSQPQPSQPQPSQPQQGPPAQQQPAQQAQQPGAQHGHRDEQAQPGRPEATRVVSPADPTAHPQPAPGAPGQPVQHPASPPAGFAGPQQRPWNAAQEDPAPPWGGESFPPLTPRTSSGWAPTQGPGAFDEPASPGTGRRIALSALAVVLLAGVGLVVWLLAGSGDDPDEGGRAQEPGRMSRISSSAPPSPTSSPLPSPPPAKQTPTDNPSALIDLPGETRDGGGEFDRETMVDRKVLPGSFAEALLDTDMGKGLLRTTIVDEQVTIGLYAIEVGDQAEAVSMVEEYGKTQVNGSIPFSRELSLQGVPAYASPDDGNSFYRTAYALYDRVIVLDVFGDDPERVRDMFVEIRDEQIAHAPPSTTDF